MKAPIVLIPGLQSDCSSWLPLVERLVHRFPLSLPMGHQFDTTIQDMARHVLDQSPRRFHLVGWSMGGYVAFEILRQAPERLLSLGLISTTAAPETAQGLPRRDQALAMARQQGLRAYQQNNLGLSIYKPAQLASAMKTPMIDASEILGIQAFESQIKAVIARADSRADLGASTLPLFILAGTKDAIIPVAHAREMHRLRPDAQYHEIPDCGHCPPLEAPDLVMQLLQDWLCSLPDDDAIATPDQEMSRASNDVAP